MYILNTPVIGNLRGPVDPAELNRDHFDSWAELTPFLIIDLNC